jgi:hypothetical protein
MRLIACFAALVLGSLGSLVPVSIPGSSPGTRTIDDPPPEPIDCPLCGGNPQVHVARTFAIVDTGSDLATCVLRW